MYRFLCATLPVVLLTVACSNPHDLPPDQQPARYISDTEKNRRAREINSFVQKNVSSVGIRSIGYASTRRYDFESSVRRFASRMGAAYVGPIAKANFSPDFYIYFEVDKERSRDRNYATFTITASFIKAVAEEQGQKILAVSEETGRCIEVGFSAVLFSCEELPPMMAEAALYSFIHP